MYKKLDEFITYLFSEAGKSSNTCLSYGRDIRQFIDWLKDGCGIGSINDVAPEKLSEYESFLREENKSPATISRSAASLKAFFSYAQRNGWIMQDPSQGLRSPKVIKKRPSIISDAEILKLLSQPAQDNAKGVRDRAMLELLCDTGLRVSELIGIKTEDINIGKRTLKVPGGRSRYVTFDRRIGKYLFEYAEKKRPELLSGKEDPGTFFVNIDGNAMSRQGFWKIIKKYGETAGINEELTPHVLRHSFAAHALKNGKDVKDVQKVMGHADISTTNGYVNL